MDAQIGLWMLDYRLRKCYAVCPVRKIQTHVDRMREWRGGGGGGERKRKRDHTATVKAWELLRFIVSCVFIIEVWLYFKSGSPDNIMLILIKDEDYFIIHIMHHSFLYAGGAPRRAVGHVNTSMDSMTRGHQYGQYDMWTLVWTVWHVDTSMDSMTCGHWYGQYDMWTLRNAE